MRTAFKVPIAALAIAAGLAACGRRSTDTASRDDFNRDLQLASSTNLDLAGGKVDSTLLNSLETKPGGSPEVASTLRKGAGDHAVASRTPTVRATPETEVANVEDGAQTRTTTEAPDPDVSEPVAVAPRSTPVGMPASGGGDYGTDGGGVFGGGRGVIIRGGGVDGDHCQPHGGRTGGVPIFLPMPTVPRSGPISISGRVFGGGAPARSSGSARSGGRGIRIR